MVYKLIIPKIEYGFTSTFMCSTNDMYFYVPYKKNGKRLTTHAVKTKQLL